MLPKNLISVPLLADNTSTSPASRTSFPAKRFAVSFEEIGKHYKIISISSIYETEAWGETQQQNFLNAVIEIEASESSRKIFSTIKSIEKNIGRIERGKWQAREIDIDILLNENEILELSKNYSLIGIDEAQFFDEDIRLFLENGDHTFFEKITKNKVIKYKFKY